ncbi:MAG: DNA-directed RNA polymerase subunit beta' [Fibrobacter sp.]|nr:DNA-directed RNA polymerase subunit beta' [Fibrobacter sp.]
MDKTVDLIENKGDITIQLASPEVIRQWSYGEVVKPETINYRSFKPEKDGLFCEQIFGPVKNWECNCGKYKKVRFKGIVCERCNVEVTHSTVRRERMGHVELAVPVAHIWFFRSQPNIIGSLLGFDSKSLEAILYYQKYVVFDPGDTALEEKELIDVPRYDDLWKENRHFDARTGAPAIRQLLARLNLDELSAELRATIEESRSRTRRTDALKRLKIVESFRKSPNRPEWMILDVLPVIPPDLRPLVPLEGGRFATSDLNELYQRVINRNNRLKKLIDVKAPEVILRNEKRLLQAAVDDLFDNSRRTNFRGTRNNRPLKSLSGLLKGKQGRFRQNLLGKRVDYSGRSVIVVGPELMMHQCGLPKSMALELYKPFIIQRLQEEGTVHTLKSAKKYVEKERPEVWDILESIIEDNPVLLNRAPTLHRLGIQAFYTKLIEGKAIQLHPLVCAAFNADFDGDQMEVHLPLSFETQLECRVLMMSTNNLLHPASGQPIAVPSQDMVLGLYYLTKTKVSGKGHGMRFSDVKEVVRAYENGFIGLNSWIGVKLLAGTRIYRSEVKAGISVKKANGKEVLTTENEKLENALLLEDTVIKTTAGRVFLNEVFPEKLGFPNETFNKKVISKSIDDLYRITGNRVTVAFLDDLKDLGFDWATKAGSSVAISDMIVPPEKDTIVEKTEQKAEEILSLYQEGMITDGERYNQVIDSWSHATNEVANKLFDQLSFDKEGFNPVFMMADSGARGSREQIKQLSGMRGLMQKPVKKLGGQEVIENPIKSSFREGLNVLEYFISTHGARKGLADTALKTADAGYLTRRLVDVAQELVITEDDCNTDLGINLYASKDGDDVIQSLEERILGRVAAVDILHPVSEEILVERNHLIEERDVDKIVAAGIEYVSVRSVLTCESIRGVCAKCYGRNLAAGRPVDLGEAVGVIAAQSIGEPGTQLTLRTFHIGGASSRLTVENNKKSTVDGKVRYENLQTVEFEGKHIVTSRSCEVVVYDTNQILRARFEVPYGSTLEVLNDEEVKAEQVLFTWDPYNSVILSNVEGKVEYSDLINDVTYREEYNEATGITTLIVIPDRRGRRRVGVNIVDDKGERVGFYPLPNGAVINVTDGEKVSSGSILAKIPRAVGKTRDITGGLPRIAELFEARKPKNQSVLAPIDGIVYHGGEERNNQKIIIRSETEKDESGAFVENVVLVPRGKHLSVHEGDRVRIGEKLCSGSINPHDILAILGTEEVQRHLVDEIQAVYRLQGVAISDKHIECIVKQMMRKVRIRNPGDTEFLPQDEVSIANLRLENEKALAEDLQPATYSPMLLGITKSSLGADSFISAASFQETTKILTRAAIEGCRDELVGLKENVIMGRLIPSGTGAMHLRGMTVVDTDALEDFERDEAETGDDSFFEEAALQLDGDLETQEEGSDD